MCLWLCLCYCTWTRKYSVGCEVVFSLAVVGGMWRGPVRVVVVTCDDLGLSATTALTRSLHVPVFVLSRDHASVCARHPHRASAVVLQKGCGTSDSRVSRGPHLHWRAALSRRACCPGTGGLDVQSAVCASTDAQRSTGHRHPRSQPSTLPGQSRWVGAKLVVVVHTALENRSRL